MYEDQSGQECLCGSTRFERVVVERQPGVALVTDFLACISCRTVLHFPSHSSDPDEALKRDAAIAARDYRKPGHRKR